MHRPQSDQNRQLPSLFHPPHPGYWLRLPRKFPSKVKQHLYLDSCHNRLEMRPDTPSSTNNGMPKFIDDASAEESTEQLREFVIAAHYSKRKFQDSASANAAHGKYAHLIKVIKSQLTCETGYAFEASIAPREALRLRTSNEPSMKCESSSSKVGTSSETENAYSGGAPHFWTHEKPINYLDKNNLAARATNDSKWSVQDLVAGNNNSAAPQASTGAIYTQPRIKSCRQPYGPGDYEDTVGFSKFRHLRKIPSNVKKCNAALGSSQAASKLVAIPGQNNSPTNAKPRGTAFQLSEMRLRRLGQEDEDASAQKGYQGDKTTRSYQSQIENLPEHLNCSLVSYDVSAVLLLILTNPRAKPILAEHY